MLFFSFTCLNLENVAVRKTAYSSDIYNEHEARNAIDGNLAQALDDGSCFHALPDINAFWEVDLGGKFLIDHVTIYNRRNIYKCLLHSIASFFFSTPENNFGRIMVWRTSVRLYVRMYVRLSVSHIYFRSLTG
mgnify:CR=1 FL=1